MANEVLTAQLTGLIPEITAMTIFKFNQLVGVMGLVRVEDSSGIPGKTVEFPKYSAVTSADVNAIAEGTDASTNKQVTNAPVLATISFTVPALYARVAGSIKSTVISDLA